jgi:hypothetical protein
VISWSAVRGGGVDVEVGAGLVVANKVGEAVGVGVNVAVGVEVRVGASKVGEAVEVGANLVGDAVGNGIRVIVAVGGCQGMGGGTGCEVG